MTQTIKGRKVAFLTADEGVDRGVVTSRETQAASA
jgi:hypothetical protein